MKQLNDYIIEKFKISKDITNQEEYEEGDYLLRVFISNSNYKNYNESGLLYSIEIGLSNNALAIFSELKENKFIFINHKTGTKDHYDYEMKYEINSNGYLEFDNVTKPAYYSFKSISLYLKPNVALNFLNEILNDKSNIKKYIFNYVDKKYEKYFDLSNLYITNSTDSIEKLIGYLNEKA